MQTPEHSEEPNVESQLTDDLKALALPMAMSSSAIALLLNIETARDPDDLDRCVTFANGFTLGLDRDHVSQENVSKLQGIYLDAYVSRRNQLEAA